MIPERGAVQLIGTATRNYRNLTACTSRKARIRIGYTYPELFHALQPKVAERTRITPIVAYIDPIQGERVLITARSCHGA